MAKTLEARLRRAFERRISSLGPETTAFRALNAKADGVPDVTVDWFAGVAVVSLYRALSGAEEAALLSAVEAALAPRSVYLKRRPREARVVATTRKAEVAPEVPALGEPVGACDAREDGVTFVIRPAQGLGVGLYLDARDARAWVRANAGGRTVLNTFAYTCGFGVCALLGGAGRAVNLDLSRRVLDWGEENLAKNGLVPDRRDFVAGDCFDWLGRFAKKGERFDLVILDPPSFSTHRGGRFSARRDYPKLAAAAAGVLAPSGLLVCCCNLEDLPGPGFEALVARGLEGTGARFALRHRLGPSSVDFPAHPEEPAALKVRVYQRG